MLRVLTLPFMGAGYLAWMAFEQPVLEGYTGRDS
jgi:hypothetical protein